MPFVHHPVFTADIREVSADKLAEFEESGWKKVPQKEEKSVAAKAAPVQDAAQK
jgi:hypothetical protein